MQEVEPYGHSHVLFLIHIVAWFSLMICLMIKLLMIPHKL